MNTRESRATCNHCSIVGHFKKNCPQLKPKVEEVEDIKAVILVNVEEVRQLVTQCQPDIVTLHMKDGFAYRMENRINWWLIKYL